MMRVIGPILGRLRIGRLRDWYRFTWARLRTDGRVVAEALPQIDPPFRLKLARGATLKLGTGVRFRPGFYAEIGGTGVVEIGDEVLFNVGTYIGCTTKVTIGRDGLIGPYVTITDGNHRIDRLDEPIKNQGLSTREIAIGSNVWLGAKATVINSVGDNSVVGANAVVARPVPADSLATGIPATSRPRETRGGDGHQEQHADRV